MVAQPGSDTTVGKRRNNAEANSFPLGAIKMGNKNK